MHVYSRLTGEFSIQQGYAPVQMQASDVQIVQAAIVSSKGSRRCHCQCQLRTYGPHSRPKVYAHCAIL